MVVVVQKKNGDFVRKETSTLKNMSLIEFQFGLEIENCTLAIFRQSYIHLSFHVMTKYEHIL